VSRARTAAAAAGLVTAAALLLDGCAIEAEPAPTLGAVLAERRATVDAAEAARHAAFLADSGGRLAELGLPLPAYQGLVDITEWDSVVTDCIERFDPGVRIARLEGGFQILDPDSATESIERIRWTIESCSAQHGLLDPEGFDSEPGPVERAWRYRDAVDRILPCLRAGGFPVPVPPRVGAPVAADPDGSAPGAEARPVWNPYARIAMEATGLDRAVALCPPSDTLLPHGVSGTDTGPQSAEGES
jgi:hypothetical protein